MGLIPVTLQKPAGMRTDPPVSSPMENPHSPADIAAAAPPLDPPGTRSKSQGLWVLKKAEFSQDDPMPNSSMLVLPSRTAPAVRQFLGDGGVVLRDVVFQNFGGAGRAHAASGDGIFHREGNARQRGDVAFGDALVGLLCLLQRHVICNGDVGLKFLVHFMGTLQGRLS